MASTSTRFESSIPQHTVCCGYLTFDWFISARRYWAHIPVSRLVVFLASSSFLSLCFWQVVSAIITFNQGLFLVAIPQLFTLYKTVKYARRRAFAKHRYWAVLHTTSCYVIHLFRVYLAIAFMLGTVLAKSPLTFQTALGVPQGLQEKEDAERAVFAFCTVLAGITGFAWTRKVLSQAPKQM
ncbi:hypothetical protein L1887_51337 [Cichorium endivia]|nr:hypothetical protein L1887_51337 [Cichorium endivia]